MTCIVAIKKEGVVYMGADSAGVDTTTLRFIPRSDPKIYIVGPFMFGFTTSFRMGQLLGHAFVAPYHDPEFSVEKFMTTVFIDAVRDCLKAGGWATKENDQEYGGDFLVAYKGRIFNVDSAYQVGESSLSYEAIGCGSDFALGALYAAGDFEDPWHCIELALRASEKFSCGVSAPFTYHKQISAEGPLSSSLY